jgi:hypothetical protein
MNQANELYAFDEEFTEICFNARPGAENPSIVYHRLRKPTLAELIEREQQSKYELVEISNREDEVQTDEDVANARLWDKIIVSVKGYRGAEDWRELSEQEKASMRIGHKAMAIRAMYSGFCEIEGDENGVSIGADTWTVRQSIGLKRDAPDFVVRHILREPTEAERVKFKRSASSTSYVKGAKKQQVRIKTNLKAFVELYDALISLTTGATVGGNEFPLTSKDKSIFLAAIDPIWKRQVVQTLMATIEAQLSD